MGLGIPKRRIRTVWCFLLAFVIASILEYMTQIMIQGKWMPTPRTGLTNAMQPTFRKETQAQQSHKIQQETSTRENIEFSVDAKECPELRLPRLDGYFDHWQNASTNQKHFVFSAYIDETFIRLIGATLILKDDTEPIFCQIWHKKTSVDSIPEQAIIPTPIITTAKLDMLPTDPNKTYIATFFKCPFPKDILPYTVSLVTGNPCQRPLNHVIIAQPATRTKKYKFAVCVNAFHTNFNNAHLLVESIELNRILGADHFTFYDLSTGPNVKTVLDMYIDRGLAELISWKIPVNDLNYFGQLACLNDCFYRNRRDAEYIVNTDLDEFIIPTKNEDKTWTDMLDGLPNKGAYIFRTTFFPMSWQNSDVPMAGYDIVQRYQLRSLLKLDRESIVWPVQKRSKYIVKANAGTAIGVHISRQLRKPWHWMFVGVDIGLNHHYRVLPLAGATMNKTQDLTMLKYRGDLIRQVPKAWERITDRIGTIQDIRNSLDD